MREEREIGYRKRDIEGERMWREREIYIERVEREKENEENA